MSPKGTLGLYYYVSATPEITTADIYQRVKILEADSLWTDMFNFTDFTQHSLRIPPLEGSGRGAVSKLTIWKSWQKIQILQFHNKVNIWHRHTIITWALYVMDFIWILNTEAYIICLVISFSNIATQYLSKTFQCKLIMPADNLPTVAIAMKNTLPVQQKTKTTRHSLHHDETNNHMGKNKLNI